MPEPNDLDRVADAHWGYVESLADKVTHTKDPGAIPEAFADMIEAERDWLFHALRADAAAGELDQEELRAVLDNLPDGLKAAFEDFRADEGDRRALIIGLLAAFDGNLAGNLRREFIGDQ